MMHKRAALCEGWACEICRLTFALLLISDLKLKDRYSAQLLQSAMLYAVAFALCPGFFYFIGKCRIVYFSIYNYVSIFYT